MAYLPGPIENDLFVSYAHEDKAWVTRLQEQLTERLLHRLGCQCNVWHDEKNLRAGQNIPKELDKAIRASAAFIAVLSRGYQNSKWCEKELAAFLDATKKGTLETGGHGRLLKVIKFPWVDNAHEDFHGDYKDVAFFDRDKSGQEQEFRRTSEAFRKAVDKLSFHIEKLFDAMLLGLEKVFVGHAPEDATDERDSLIREIRAAGYALSPPPLGAIPSGLARERLRKFMEEARLSVHLLGAAFDPAVPEQIDLALEAGRKVIFYFTRGHEKATGKQRTLIDETRANKRNLPAGSWMLLENRSPVAQRQDLIELLRPSRRVAAAGNGAARVYFLCDPNSEDAGFAREVQAKIREKEKFDVALPQPASNTSSPAAEHERLLRWCDGLLLNRPLVLSNWYERHFTDFITAEYRERERKLKKKAVLVNGDPVAIPEVTVIQRREPILEQLEPFLAPLRTLQREAAHAGD